MCLRRLLELKGAVSQFLSSSQNPESTFRENEWTMIQRVVAILTPFEELTLELSRDEFILPAVKVLSTFFSKSDRQLKTQKLERC